MADARWVHKTCGDPEYAGHVLLVGVDDVRFPDPGNLEFQIPHVQDLTDSDTWWEKGK